MRFHLTFPQAPGEMTQLAMIKAEPQEVNQFLKVTQGKSVQRGTGHLWSWASDILTPLDQPIHLLQCHLLCSRQPPSLPCPPVPCPQSITITRDVCTLHCLCQRPSHHSLTQAQSITLHHRPALPLVYCPPVHCPIHSCIHSSIVQPPIIH